MINDVKIPPLPEGDFDTDMDYHAAWTADQMRAFYLQGYNDGRNAPHVLGAGLDPWPDSGNPAISDALRAPDDAILPERKPLTDELIAALALGSTTYLRFARAIEAAHGIGEK